MTEVEGGQSDLPAIVRQAGGTLAEVLAWPQHKDLGTGTMYDIIAITETYPDLDNEHAIDLLADMAGHHGVELSVWFEEQLETYGIDRVYLAVDAMEEMGIRPQEASGATFVGTLADMLSLLEKFDDAEVSAVTVEGIDDRIRALGGWGEVRHLSVEEIRCAFEPTSEEDGES